jgi:hypothetical protein
VHETVAVNKPRRIMMSFATTSIFNQRKLIPLRFMPLVVELELTSDGMPFLHQVVADGATIDAAGAVTSAPPCV